VGFGIRSAEAKPRYPTPCMLFNVQNARQFFGDGVVLGQSPVDITGRASSCVFGVPIGSNAFAEPLSPVLTITAQRGPRTSFAGALGPQAPDSNSTRTRIRFRDPDIRWQTAWYTTTPSGSDDVLVMYRKGQVWPQGQLWSVRVRGTRDDFATSKAVMR